MIYWFNLLKLLRSLRSIFLATFLVGGLYGLLGHPPLPALSAGGDEVSGQVVNGSVGERGVGGTSVILQLISPEGQPTQKSTTTDASGHFHFLVTATPAMQYRLLTMYKGVTYASEQKSLKTGKPVQVKLSVYEVTHNDTGVRIEKVYVFLGNPDVTTQQIMAIELFTFLNVGTKTYVGELPAQPRPPVPGEATQTTPVPSGPPHLLRFSLPPGANTFVPHAGLENAEIIPVDLGFATDAAVPPGEHQLAFTYQFPYTPGSYSFTQLLPYRTGYFYLLTPLPLKASVPELTPQGSKKIEENVYQLLSGTKLEAGTRLTIHLKDLPASPASKRQATIHRLQVILINLALLCSGFVLLYALRGPAALRGMIELLGNLVLFRWKDIRLTDKGRGFNSAATNPVAAGDEEKNADVNRRRQQLLQKIAALDDAFDAGALKEAEYQARREAYKAELTKILSLSQAVKSGLDTSPSPAPRGNPGSEI